MGASVPIGQGGLQVRRPVAPAVLLGAASEISQVPAHCPVPSVNGRSGWRFPRPRADTRLNERMLFS